MILMALVIGTLCPAPVAACPNCTEILNESTSGTPTIDRQQAEGLATGFYWSILMMIATPFSIVGGLGAMLYFNIRKNAPQSEPGRPRPRPPRSPRTPGSPPGRPESSSPASE